MNMTQDQFMGLLRQVLPIVGSLLVTMGWMTPADEMRWITLAMEVAGPGFIIYGVVWTFIANSKKSILTSAANMPEVKNIVLDPNKPQTSELNQATPSNVKPA